MIEIGYKETAKMNDMIGLNLREPEADDETRA